MQGHPGLAVLVPKEGLATVLFVAEPKEGLAEEEEPKVGLLEVVEVPNALKSRVV